MNEKSYMEIKSKNLSLNEKEIKEGKLRLQSLPVSLYIDINLKCNLQCPSCFRSDPKLRNKSWPTMDFETFEKIAHELFPTAHRAILSGGGESIIHKDFDDILKLTLHYQVRPVLYTNATLLNEKRLMLLVRAGTYLAISINGATKEKFEKLRYPAKWERLTQSLDLIKETREKENNQDFFPYFGVVVQKDNLKELSLFVDLSVKHGFELIKYSKLDPYFAELERKMPDPEDADKEFINAFEKANKNKIRLYAPDYGKTSFTETLKKLREENASIQISLDKNNPDRFVKYPSFESKFCEIPWKETMITPEGKVVVGCCSGYLLGDINKETFATIWNNKKYQKLRKKVNSKRPLRFCRVDSCPFRK